MALIDRHRTRHVGDLPPNSLAKAHAALARRAVAAGDGKVVALLLRQLLAGHVSEFYGIRQSGLLRTQHAQ